MSFDADIQLAAVTRTVACLERDGRRPARAVTLARSHPTTVEDLWDALTSAERIPLLVPTGQRRARAGRSFSA